MFPPTTHPPLLTVFYGFNLEEVSTQVGVLTLVCCGLGCHKSRLELLL